MPDGSRDAYASRRGLAAAIASTAIESAVSAGGTTEHAVIIVDPADAESLYFGHDYARP